MRIVLVAGARPNYPKVAPLYRALSAHVGVEVVLVDTGQHYDPALASEMREDLELPEPQYELRVGSDPRHAWQTAKVMGEFDDVLVQEKPDCVVVVGDVNSTLACALVTVKAWDASGHRPLLAHVEAGLRSFDLTMPEEINRVVTDSISDLLFVSEQGAVANLAAENVDQRVFFSGNVMVDSLLRYVADLPPVEHRPHILATLHRPATVDHPETLAEVMSALVRVAGIFSLPVLLVCHPRTEARLKDLGVANVSASYLGVHFLPAKPYRSFIDLVRTSRLVLTDSGGLQEETTVLKVPCLTLRYNTERPVTIAEGTNTLVGTTWPRIVAAATKEYHTPMVPPELSPLNWDGHAAERIAAVLVQMVRRS